jgi:nitrogen-specific signal transduction histidine kinase
MIFIFILTAITVVFVILYLIKSSNYNKLIRSAIHPICIVNKTGEITNVPNIIYITDNPLGTRHLLHSNILSYVDSEKDKERLSTAIKNVIEGNCFSNKVLYQTKDKNGKPLLLRFKILAYNFDKAYIHIDSDPIGYVDKEDQNQLNEKVLDSIGLPIAIRDASKKLEYVFFNKKAEELFEVKREKVIGNCNSSFIDKESGNILNDYALNRNGKEIKLTSYCNNGSKKLDLSVFQSEIKSGDHHLVTSCFIDKSLLDCICAGNDLLLEQCKMTMQMAGMVFWIWDITNRSISLLSENRSYPNDIEFGYSEEAMLKMVKSEDNPRLIALMESVRNKKIDTLNVEFECYKKSEEKYVWAVSYGKVYKYDENDNPLIMIGATFNNNMLKELEKKVKKADNVLQLSSTSKSTLLNNINLIINNPLNSIIGYSQLIEEETDSDKRKQYVKALQNDSADLLNKINMLMQIANIQSGNATFIKQPVDLNGLIIEMSGLAKNQNHNDNVTIETDIPKISTTLMLDSRYLIKVMNNLITNALKYTSTGTITLGYSIYPDKSVYVFIEDTGSGISPEKTKNLFDKFSSQSSRRHPDSGLGLPLCKAIIERLGGEIGVDSEVGKGSKFWFTINPGY